jgi:hypothetical protein
MPRSSRYQLRQPVIQTVFFAASTRAASNAAVAAALGLIASRRPARISSTSFRMYAIWSSATSINEKYGHLRGGGA